MNNRPIRIICALAIGSVLAFSPVMLLKVDFDSRLISTLKWGGAYLAIPGTFLGLIASGGRIDDINFRITDVANLAFYGGLAYVSLGFWPHRIKEK
jgi:hypothetical protein